MKEDWDRRAHHDAWYYVSHSHYKSEEEFDKSGQEIAAYLLDGVPVGREMLALDIGCGVGRLEKFLWSKFAHVYGVDVSSEMIRLAKVRLADIRNVHLFENNGRDLSLFGDNTFDFVFSYLTLQHLPRSVVSEYTREAARVLRTNGLFKFQIFVGTKVLWRAARVLLLLRPEPAVEDTLSSRVYSESELVSIAAKAGLEALEIRRYRRARVPIVWYAWMTCKKKQTPASRSDAAHLQVSRRLSGIRRTQEGDTCGWSRPDQIASIESGRWTFRPIGPDWMIEEKSRTDLSDLGKL